MVVGSNPTTPTIKMRTSGVSPSGDPTACKVAPERLHLVPMVSVAQSVERPTVTREVAGAEPVRHPIVAHQVVPTSKTVQ